ncbi:Tat protein secretion system quality control protein TatD (DNase) [Geosmithia morbida]|uniref:Tat protein secretion system quality control protein TatD (DNase) n=1 Tax=Geosmithia morbida TaxID=1094350 RepID=A0A9P4Z0M7_9HYPO|nr:Tat protein secretion system quality control protein TatD (DNase) [Geosmithia morbida]KAF4125242.1 Tat protein secretion system quality control protein TatD (DNase) [Geosmithia morbida]
MGKIPSIPGMRTRAMAIMATRSQDQHLVASVADDLGLAEDDSPVTCLVEPGRRCFVIPSFGWHPWFSHQLYDDTAPNPTYSPANEGKQEEAKMAHYTAVLAPAPKDADFVAALPVPTPLSSVVESMRELAAARPHALIGETGLDKAFRLPFQWGPDDDAASRAAGGDDDETSLTPGGREGRRLSPYRVRIQHQQAIMTAQLRLAGDLGRPVSVHGVQVHGVLHDTISSCWKGHEKEVVSRRQKRMVAPKAEDLPDFSDDDGDGPADPDSLKDNKKQTTVGGKPFPPRICLHSFSGSVEVLKQWLRPAIPADIFFSFSSAVNLGTDGGRAKLGDIVKAVPDRKILVESDLHVAGDEMEAALEDMYRFVCRVKGWTLEDGVVRIRENFRRFIVG